MALRRGCSAEMIAALSGHFHPAVLIDADWHDGPVRVHSGTGDMQWAGKTWQGIGYRLQEGSSFVDFEAPVEAGGLTADGGMVRVAATVQTMLGEQGKLIRNRPITAWFGVTTKAAGNVLTTDAVQLFTGYFDERSFSFSRESNDFSHDMVLGLAMGPAPRAQASINHSAEDQAYNHLGDTAGRHLIIAPRNQINPVQWPEP